MKLPRVGGTVRFFFTTHAASGAAVAPSSAFEAADVRVYKDGSATQRTSEAGYTMTSPFDSLTGLHLIAIDLSDNTDAGFYAVGSEYDVVLSPDETVDSLAVIRVIGSFRIMPAEGVTGHPKVDVGAWLGTAAATPTVAGVPEVDVTHYAGSTSDVSTIPASVAAILVDTGTTLQGELDGIQADTEDIQTRLPAALTADGNIKADTLRIGGTLQTANDVGGDVDAILVDTGTTLDGRIPAALVGGRMDSNVGAISSDATAADNLEAALDGTGAVTITAALTGNITGNLSGSVGSVTGAVGSVTGNVGGNVTGSVGSVAAGGITASSIADGAIDAATFAADVDAEILSYIVDDATRIDASSLNTASVTTIPAIAADHPNRITKNTALSAFMFKMVDATDGFTAETGVTVTATRSLDGAAFASCANSASEVASGWYKIDLAAGDLNGNTVVLRFTGTGCRTTECKIVTQPT